MTPPIEKGTALYRHDQLQRLRATLRQANVPDATINQIIEEEEHVEVFTGFVLTVGSGFGPSGGDATSVILHGQCLYSDRKKYWLSFPPNPPKFLAELVRAQSHPLLRVHLTAKEKPEPGGWGTGESPQIITLDVYYHGAAPPVASDEALERAGMSSEIGTALCCTTTATMW